MSEWAAMDFNDGLFAIKKFEMKLLPCSCDHYRYFGTRAHPLLKLDSHRHRFYLNDDYLELVTKLAKNNLDK
jgi:hypothetical protein